MLKKFNEKISGLYKVIEIEKKLNKSHDELTSKLNRMAKYFVFRHMNCEFVPGIWETFFK